MKLTVKDIILIPLFAALTAVGAFIKIPMPFIPFTLQTFFVALSGVLLGAKKGALSQLIYVAIGLMGLPVFTNGQGIGYIFQPSFGYLLGFILAAFTIGLLIERVKNLNLFKIYGIILAGLLVIYALGVPYLYLINNFYNGKAMSFQMALYYGFILTIGKDCFSLLLAAILSSRLLPVLHKMGYVKWGKREKQLS